MSHADRWLGAALVASALAWLWLVSTQIPDAGTEWPGPRGFPQLLGILLALLGVWMMSAAGTRIPDPGSPTRDHGSPSPDPGSRAREIAVAGGTFGVLLLYAFLLEHAGFLVATPVVIVLAMAGLLRMRRWVPIVSLAAGVTLGCWVIFDTLLGSPLPRGSWIVW
jgi:hypothetical protein